ncbi:carboxylesterase precursor [Desulforamulus reducens MI-1]|uniref:Carboxylesterase n=1 Tax=Desulforamulus reducens (strain ATCC BAA-1160 / DSM 100696 / MI-1) TaxID=349161 RepID=A4J634_DESRM|nr:carboxylesterase precursor [Desulforamulus reducens MI-1]
MLPLAEYLRGKGYHVVTPTLAGHQCPPKQLKKVTFLDWIHSAECELKGLLSAGYQASIVGFSMGGLIGIQLAQKYPLQALVNLSTPIYIWNMKQITHNILKGIKNKDHRRINQYIFQVSQTPINAALNFKILLSKTKPLIPLIKTSHLIIQGLQDDTVNFKSANYIYQRSSAKHKELFYLDKSGHLICCDLEKEQVFLIVESFLGKL